MEKLVNVIHAECDRLRDQASELSDISCTLAALGMSPLVKRLIAVADEIRKTEDALFMSVGVAVTDHAKAAEAAYNDAVKSLLFERPVLLERPGCGS